MTVREMLDDINTAVRTHQARGGGGGQPWDIAIYLAGMRSAADVCNDEDPAAAILSAAEYLAEQSGQPQEPQ